MMIDVISTFLASLLARSDLLSHITRRIVDSIGGDPQEASGETVVVVIDELPALQANTVQSFDISDWLVIPVPGRFMIIEDGFGDSCLLGVVLDKSEPYPASLAWAQIDWDQPISMSVPANALGAMFAVIEGQALALRKVETFGSVDGCTVLGLRH